MKAHCFLALLWGLILLPAAAPVARAQVEIPQTIAYQGYLTNTDGDPANGATSVIFSLYDDDTGGAQLWQETQQGVVFTDGIFSVQLGSVESLDAVPFGQPLWLNVEVVVSGGGRVGLRPRVPFSAVPYAMSVRGFRTLPGDDGVPNVILGIEDNYVDEGVSGAVISGGGGTFLRANQVTANYGTIGGGNMNSVSGPEGTVAGGVFNHAEGLSSTVSGGSSNEAEGRSAIVPGGSSNQAVGDYSFAAGYKAEALHDGAFVWSGFFSGSDVPFTSTAPRQFLIRASGGVGVGTNAPQGAFHTNDPIVDRPDLVVGGASNDDDGIIASDPALPSSDLHLVSNGGVGIKLDSNSDEPSALFFINDGEEDPLLIVSESGRTGVLELRVDETATAGAFEAEDDLGDTDTPVEGGVYRDNVVYAWAHVQGNGSVVSSFGCTVTRTGTGTYTISYKRTLGSGASPIVSPLSANDPVLASISSSSPSSASVKIQGFVDGQFQTQDRDFFIQVVGRP